MTDSMKVLGKICTDERADLWMAKVYPPKELARYWNQLHKFSDHWINLSFHQQILATE